MKIKIALLSLLALFLYTSKATFAADKFEGKITFHLNAQNKTNEMDIPMTIKGGKTLFEVKVNEMKMKVLNDNTAKKLFMIMDAQKMAVSTSFDNFTPMLGIVDSVKKQIKIYKTDKTKKICGYTCGQLILEAKGEKIEIWATSEIGSGVSQNKFAETGAIDQFPQEFFGLGVLEIVGSKFDLVATKVEKKSITDNEIQIPSDYMKIDAPMGAGLNGMNPSMNGKKK